MIGVIADDVTGGTDVAVAFRREGMRTAIFFDTPARNTIDPHLDAAVIALKTRTIDPADAVAQSLDAARQMIDAGVSQIYFKYCSTFDSRPAGNIGPVFEALRELLRVDSVVTTPSSPEHGRTTYNGYLFVNDLLLHESHMRDHPLTPMRDSSLVRLMDGQLASPGASIVLHSVLRSGSAALATAVQQQRREHRYVFPDAVTDDDLRAIASCTIDDPLVGGGAGLAGALARARVLSGRSTTRRETATSSGTSGATIVLAGSCSRRTLEQIDQMHEAGRASYRIDVLTEQDPEVLAASALRWYDSLSSHDAPLIYSSLPPAELARVHARWGVSESADILETAMARVAQGLRARGVERFIAAGGETSGAIVAALAINSGEIGDEAARGVPWIHADSGVSVLLKSGNFGAPDLLVTASRPGPQ